MRLFGNMAEFGHAPALIDEDGNITSHADLMSSADALAGVIKERSLVFCFCSNTVESVTGYVGFSRAGHVTLMLSESLDSPRSQALIDSFRPNFHWARTDTPALEGKRVVTTVGRYSLFEESTEENDLHPDLSVLMATSGSTGSPVMVRQSATNLLENAVSIAASIGLTSGDRALTTLPMNYTYGLSIVNSQLHVGGSLVVTDATLMDRRFWELVKTASATYFGGVPYTYEMLARIGVKRLRDTGIRMLTQAGGRLAPEMVEKTWGQCKDIGIDFHVMYGQTEATARMSVLRSADAPGRFSSIGKPIPGGTFRILDLDADTEMPSGETGELEYSGPNVTMGYASSRSDLALGDERLGSLRTGDLARRDEEGFFFIVGRRKRFVKLFGHRTNLDDVENHLISQGHEVACTGSDDSLVVNLVGNTDEQLIIDDVARFLSTNRKAVSVRRVDHIPRSEAGKVLYSALGTEQS